MSNYLLVAFSVAVIAVGQVLLKLAAGLVRPGTTGGYLVFVQENLPAIGIVVTALTLYLIATVTWVVALRTVPLSVAYTFNAVAFVLVPAAGFLLFNEAIPRFYVLGVLLIIGGILLIAQG